MSNNGGSSSNSSQSGTSSSANSLPSWLTGAYQSNLGTSTGLQQADLGATAGAPQLLGQGMNSIAGVNPGSIGAADSTLTSMLNGGYNGNATGAYNAANPAIQSEASGSLMNTNSNPYLQSTYNLGLQGIQNNVDSQFGAAGRNVLGGAPVQADQASTLASNLLGGQYATNLGATQNAQNLVSGNYNTGVGQIGSAAATAPGVTTGLYTQGNQQLAAGQTPNSIQSWYQSLLGQSATPFGQNNSATTGSGSNNTSNSLGPLGIAQGIMNIL